VSSPRGARVAHPGEEVRFVRSGDDAVIGLHEDALGLGMVVDALLDTELAPWCSPW